MPLLPSVVECTTKYVDPLEVEGLFVVLRCGGCQWVGPEHQWICDAASRVKPMQTSCEQAFVLPSFRSFPTFLPTPARIVLLYGPESTGYQVAAVYGCDVKDGVAVTNVSLAASGRDATVLVLPNADLPCASSSSWFKFGPERSCDMVVCDTLADLDLVSHSRPSRGLLLRQCGGKDQLLGAGHDCCWVRGIGSTPRDMGSYLLSLLLGPGASFKCPPPACRMLTPT